MYMILIQDCTPEFFSFWEQAQSLDLAQQIERWQTLYQAPHQDVFALYYSRWGHPDKLPAALQRFGHSASAIQAAVPLVKQRTAHVPQTLSPLLNIPQWAPPFVLLVGLFASDAWATPFRGQPTCFLALEQITDQLAGLDITLAHEATHGFHARESNLRLQTTTVGEGMFMEGLAVLVSRIICPGASEASYFWPGSERTTDGQTPATWLDECRRCWEDIRRRLLEDLDRTDEARFASYFWTRAATRQVGIPVCSGYFAGYRVVQALSNANPVAEMVRWPIERAVKEVRHTLQDLTTDG
jgi:hypothetical protein